MYLYQVGVSSDLCRVVCRGTVAEDLRTELDYRRCPKMDASGWDGFFNKLVRDICMYTGRIPQGS